MNPVQFANKNLCQPWNMPVSRARIEIASLVSRLRGDRPAEDDCGDPLPVMQVTGDVAIIPITGRLMMNIPGWIKQWGLNITDANDIASELTQAIHDPRVAMIVLDFDSPGGWSTAGDKLFAIVEAANRAKPVFAWCADGADMASSAYEAAAPARMILTGAFASVGCIGSYMVALDDTEMWKMMGISVEVFRSGALKGIGEDALSTAQRAFLQQMVDDCGERFRSNVSKYRTALPAAEMQGQYYDGHIAAAKGFTHGTAPDLAAAMQRFRAFR